MLILLIFHYLFKVCMPKLKLGFHFRIKASVIFNISSSSAFSLDAKHEGIIPKNLIAMIESGVSLLSISSFKVAVNRSAHAINGY